MNEESIEFMESFMSVILDAIEANDWSDKEFACMVWAHHAYPETTWSALKNRWRDAFDKRRRHLKIEDVRRMAEAMGLPTSALLAMVEGRMEKSRRNRAEEGAR